MYNPPMQGIPWNTIALGSLLLISARSTGGQEVKSPQPEKSKPPVKMEQRGRILGIGGVFFKSANRDRSEERRVGEEGRSRGAPDHLKKKKRRRVFFFYTRQSDRSWYGYVHIQWN